MLAILKKFFNFCDRGDRRKLCLSMILGVVKAFFAALRIPAIGIVAMGIINNDMSAKHIWGAFGVMCVSVLGQILIGLKTTMLQCEAGYHCSCNKRMEIAEHLRYLPMGYFNRNSLGRITNITTNTMEGLADVATRVIMMTTQGILTTAVITIMIFCFDWRIGVILLIGVAVFGIFNALMQMSAKRAAPRKAVADEALVSAVIEYVQGIAEVKNFNLTGNEAKKLSKAIREKSKGDTLLEYSVIPFMTLQNIMTKLLGIAMCVASVKFYFDGSMELLYTVMMTVSSFLVYESLELMGNFSALLRTIDIAVILIEQCPSVQDRLFSLQRLRTGKKHRRQLFSIDSIDRHRFIPSLVYYTNAFNIYVDPFYLQPCEFLYLIFHIAYKIIGHGLNTDPVSDYNMKIKLQQVSGALYNDPVSKCFFFQKLYYAVLHIDGSHAYYAEAFRCNGTGILSNDLCIDRYILYRCIYPAFHIHVLPSAPVHPKTVHFGTNLGLFLSINPVD